MSQSTEGFARCLCRRVVARALAASFVVTAPVAGAGAAEQAIRFTTYLREGPGVRYRALQEALTGTRVALGACAEGWCQVRVADAVGYVAQCTLRDVSEQSFPGPATCFVNREAGYLDGRLLSFCYSAAIAPGTPR